MNETKAESNVLLAFYLSILKMKFFCSINNAKGNTLLQASFTYFPFLLGRDRVD